MNLGELLPTDRIVQHLPANTVHDAAEQLVGLLVDGNVVNDATRLLARIAETPPGEAVTAGEDTFILPVRSDAVSCVGCALGVTAQPVRLTMDHDRPARIVVLLVAPYHESSTFLQALTALDRSLSQSKVCQQVLEATSVVHVSAIDDLMGVTLPGYLTVGDLMNRRPRAVWPDTPLTDVVSVMRSNKIQAVPVTSQQQEVLGMVSYSEILNLAVPHYLRTASAGEGTDLDEVTTDDPRAIAVREVMDRSVLCVKEEQTLADVANLFTGKGQDRYPVVRDGSLVGMLTRGDIVRRLYGP